jgi:hypothetical protein
MHAKGKSMVDFYIVNALRRSKLSKVRILFYSEIVVRCQNGCLKPKSSAKADDEFEEEDNNFLSLDI